MSPNYTATIPSVIAASPLHIMRGLRALLLGTEEKETAAELAARVKRLIFGMAEPLRQAFSEEEFREAFRLASRPSFLLDVAETLRSPAAEDLRRQAAVDELKGFAAEPQDARAYELADDLDQRLRALLHSYRQAAGRAGFPRPTAEQSSEAIERLVKSGDRFTDFLVGYFVASGALTMAAFTRQPWAPWQRNMLWTFGEKNLMGLGAVMGFEPEKLIEITTTKGDRDLLAAPATGESTAAAKALLDS